MRLVTDRIEVQTLDEAFQIVNVVLVLVVLFEIRHRRIGVCATSSHFADDDVKDLGNREHHVTLSELDQQSRRVPLSREPTELLDRIGLRTPP